MLSDWELLTLTTHEWLIVIYAVITVIILLVIVALIICMIRSCCCIVYGGTDEFNHFNRRFNSNELIRSSNRGFLPYTDEENDFVVTVPQQVPLTKQSYRSDSWHLNQN